MNIKSNQFKIFTKKENKTIKKMIINTNQLCYIVHSLIIFHWLKSDSSNEEREKKQVKKEIEKKQVKKLINVNKKRVYWNNSLFIREAVCFLKKFQQNKQNN